MSILFQFCQIKGFQPSFCIFRQKFSHKKKIFRQFFDSPKFKGKAIVPATSPLTSPGFATAAQIPLRRLSPSFPASKVVDTNHLDMSRCLRQSVTSLQQTRLCRFNGI